MTSTFLAEVVPTPSRVTLLISGLSNLCTAFLRYRDYPLWRDPHRWCKVLV